MKKEEAFKLFEAGKPVALVEYRGSIPEVINWRDKTTGKAMSMNRLTHNIECGPVSVQVSEIVKDGVPFNPETYVPPFKKGQQCVLLIDSFQRDKGQYKAAGKLEPIG